MPVGEREDPMIVEIKGLKFGAAVAVEAASNVPGQHDKESANEELKGLDARVDFEMEQASLDVTPEEFKEVIDLLREEVKNNFEVSMHRASIKDRAAEREHQAKMKGVE